MFKHLGTFAILAVCFFVMLISGCPDGVRDIMSPPPVAEPVVEEPVVEEPVTEEPVTEEPGTEPGMAEPVMEEPVTPPVTPPTAGLDGMVLIPAGSFEMGSKDKEYYLDENPLHTVHLDAFYMDIYEVTNAQFKAFLDANPGVLKAFEDFGDTGTLPYWSGTDYPAGRADHPVTGVSWTAALAYASWAGKRLPTEAEWEYAARGGLAGKDYPWGNTITPNDANYQNSETSAGTTPVGQYPANGYGLYDMAGNVWEWCLDVYVWDFYAASDNSRNPIAGGESLLEFTTDNRLVHSNRVMRGGSWAHHEGDLRVARRWGSDPWFEEGGIGFHLTGFRCVRPVMESPGTEPPVTGPPETETPETDELPDDTLGEGALELEED